MGDIQVICDTIVKVVTIIATVVVVINIFRKDE